MRLAQEAQHRLLGAFHRAGRLIRRNKEQIKLSHGGLGQREGIARSSLCGEGAVHTHQDLLHSGTHVLRRTIVAYCPLTFILSAPRGYPWGEEILSCSPRPPRERGSERGC